MTVTSATAFSAALPTFAEIGDAIGILIEKVQAIWMACLPYFTQATEFLAEHWSTVGLVIVIIVAVKLTMMVASCLSGCCAPSHGRNEFDI